jgi:type IV pilus assembly protein PilX
MNPDRMPRMRQHHQRSHGPRRQRGAILIVALMFLVLLTIVGVSTISGTTLEEKMAGNMREQATAFQAAESALRDAEIDLETGIGGTGNRDAALAATGGINTVFATACTASFTNGVCLQPASPPGTYQTDVVTASGWDWTSTSKTVQYGAYTGATAFSGLFRQPRYVIEYLAEKDDSSLGANTRYFRITARGWGADQNTTVTLQSVYKMPLN